MTSIALLDADFADLELEHQACRNAGVDLIVCSPGDPPPPTAEGLLVQWATVDAALLQRLEALKVVGRFGVGVDSIDVEEASQRGVAVVNAGDYATEEVAAHSVALTLALLRRLPQADRALREDQWLPADCFGIRRLSTLRAGVVGLGHIGTRVATHLQALGFDVVGHDPHASDAVVPSVQLTDLLRAVDVLSLHVPLTPDTHHLIGKEELSLLQKSAVLVNTARGPVVDESALVEALEQNELAGAALDVFEQEPLPQPHPLKGMDNVILTPHMAYYSQEALEQARQRVVSDVIAAIQDRQPLNLVNPDLRGR